jgi:hypothetical protein
MDTEQDMCISDEDSEGTKPSQYHWEDNPMAWIAEPLAIVSTIHWLETQGKTLYQHMESRFHSNIGTTFEGIVTIALTKLLRRPTELDSIFKFHPSTPSWAHFQA